MPHYEITTLEKFIVKCVYRLEADDSQEAIEAIKDGGVAYDEKEIQEGDEESIEVVSVQTLED